MDYFGSFKKVVPAPDAPHEPDPGESDDDGDAVNDDNQSTLVQFTTAIYFVEEAEPQWHFSLNHSRAVRNCISNSLYIDYTRILVCALQQKIGVLFLHQCIVKEKFLTIDIMRLGSMKGTVTVRYKTEDGSAKAGLHYESASGKVL